MIYTEKLKPITEICLNVTESCNLACRYCFTEHHPHFMSLQVAKDAGLWLIENAKLRKELFNEEITPKIGFFGGEPTLMWDSVIVPFVNWAEENNYHFIYGITSNCVLMTKDKVDFLKQHNIGLLLSMDGDKTSQDYNRPCKNSSLSSFDLVSKNLPYIAQNFPNTTFRGTITNQNANQLFHNIMYAGQQGFMHTFFIINEFEDWPEETRQIIDVELTKYALYIIDACRQEKSFIKLRPFEQAINKIIAIDNCIALNLGIDLPSFGLPDVDKCGTGNGYGSINYRGDIFSCQEIASRQGEKNIFHIGNIYTGIDEQKFLAMREAFLNRPKSNYNYEHPEKCAECKSKLVCRSNYCQINSYILYRDFGAIPDCWCWWSNLLIEKAAFVMQVLGYHKNEFFKNYLIKELRGQGGVFI